MKPLMHWVKSTTRVAMLVSPLALLPSILYAGDSPGGVKAAQLEANQIATEQAGGDGRRYGVTLSYMPTYPGSPAYSADFSWGSTNSERAGLSIWRQSVDGESRVFIEVNPYTADFWFCPGGGSMVVVQNGIQYDSARVTRGDNRSVCASITSREVFLLDQWSIYDNFDEQQAFTWQGDSITSGSINVASASGDGSTDSASGGYEEGVAEGRRQCVADPGSCGISFSDDNGSTQDGIDQCVADPASCGISLSGGDGSTAEGIAQCQRDPASCGIEVGSSTGGDFSPGLSPSYDTATGLLIIPSLKIPGPFGLVMDYYVELEQRSGTLSFDVDLGSLREND